VSVKVKYTDRGFGFVKAKDTYGEPFVVSKSSAAMIDAVWIDGRHLSKKQVAKILPFLTAFVAGEI
jgi:hypothetical protein